ncbi:MAG: hypothetical protein HWN65_21680 [Candidatus Helarchaeota archaeon]|nr:hypothetical protein [Candidatus Helarchaeota archaeon]
MPYVITTSKFPLNKAEEAAKIYVKTLKEFRSAQRALTKEVVPNAVKSTDDGIESMGVHDVKEGKLEEFLLLTQKYMVNYHNIEGYKYTIEVRFKAVEALEMIGMKMPE